MRGCVAAGMASCIHFLGLADSFDGVYGASAGSLVGEEDYARPRVAVYLLGLRIWRSSRASALTRRRGGIVFVSAGEARASALSSSATENRRSDYRH